MTGEGERITRLEVELEGLRKDMQRLESTVADLVSLLQQLKGARWLLGALFGAAALSGLLGVHFKELWKWLTE